MPSLQPSSYPRSGTPHHHNHLCPPLAHLREDLLPIRLIWSLSGHRPHCACVRGSELTASPIRGVNVRLNLWSLGRHGMRCVGLSSQIVPANAKREVGPCTAERHTTTHMYTKLPQHFETSHAFVRHVAVSRWGHSCCRCVMAAPRPLPFCAIIVVCLAVGCGLAATAPTSPSHRSPGGVHKLVLCTAALLLSVLTVAIVAVNQRLLWTLLGIC